MKSQYFVITSSEDGISISGPLEKEELRIRLVPDEDGNCWYGRVDALTFHKSIPSIDKGCFDSDAIVIIKGQVIVPQVAEVIKSFSIE